MIRIMPEDKYKAKITYFFNNKTYPFTYNMRETAPGQFLNLGIFSIKNFQVETSIAVKIQINPQNFKLKRSDKIGWDYSYILVEIYKIEDIKMAPSLMSEKRRKMNNR